MLWMQYTGIQMKVKLGHLKTIDDTVYASKALRSMYGMFWPDTLVTQSLHYSVTKEAIIAL